MDIRNIQRVSAFITKDGSEIRELLAHRNLCICRQTLAERGCRPAKHHAASPRANRGNLLYLGRFRPDAHRAGAGRRRAGRCRGNPAGRFASDRQHRPRRAEVPLLFRPGYEHDDTVLQDARRQANHAAKIITAGRPTL